MIPWLALIAIYGAALAVVRLGGMTGQRFALAALALTVAGAGYALQGEPKLGSASYVVADRAPPASLAAPRAALMGQFNTADRWQIIADSFARRGQTVEAVGIMRSAIRAHPKDYQLWVGLGNALVDHSGVLTPASEFAYERAVKLSPGHPAAPFFYGLALARSGDRQDAVAVWQQILKNAPAEAGWRPLVENEVAALGPPAPH